MNIERMGLQPRHAKPAVGAASPLAVCFGRGRTAIGVSSSQKRKSTTVFTVIDGRNRMPGNQGTHFLGYPLEVGILDSVEFVGTRYPTFQLRLNIAQRRARISVPEYMLCQR